MATLLVTVFVISLFKQTISKSNPTADHVYCPLSRNDDQTFHNTHDYGLNIYANHKLNPSSIYATDCYLRYSRDETPTKQAIISDFFDPTTNVLIMIHGWQPNANWPTDKKHFTSDQWNETVSDWCTWPWANPKKNKKKPIEPCPPTDHDAQYWYSISNNAFNVIFLDWRQYAGEPLVTFAEKKLYDGTGTCYKNKNVTTLLYELLETFLNLTNWSGKELRIAGNSLGGQFSMLLGYRIKQKSVYKDKLNRIALLDHYYSKETYNLPVMTDAHCKAANKKCKKGRKYWVGEYARMVLLPAIRKGAHGAVIENYRTSLVTNNLHIGGDNNEGLNHCTAMVELQTYFYGAIMLSAKHVAALALYLHCMKWNDSEYKQYTDTSQSEVPTCRMSTDRLKTYCPINASLDVNNYKNLKCKHRWKQIHGRYTTWDWDNQYEECDVKGEDCSEIKKKKQAATGNEEYFNEYDMDDEDGYYFDYNERYYNLGQYLYGYDYVHYEYYQLLIAISVLLIGLCVSVCICCLCVVIAGSISIGLSKYKKRVYSMDSKGIYNNV